MKRRIAARGLIFVTALCAALFLAERALIVVDARTTLVRRILYAPGDASTLEDTSDVLRALMAHRCAETPCSVFDCGFRLNESGLHTHDYQDVKPPGVTRVIGIGDSFMFYGGPVPHADEFFPRVQFELERAASRPNLEFINLGFSCLGIPSERALLRQEGMRLAPDYVVWTIYLGNDITDEGQFGADQATFAPSNRSWLTSTLHRSLLYRLGARLGDAVRRDPGGLFRRAPQRPEPPSAAAPPPCGVLENPNVPYDPKTKTLADDRYLRVGADRLKTMYIADQQPRIRQLTSQLLRAFETVKHEIGGLPVLLVIIPDEFQVAPREVERVLAAAPALRGQSFDFEYTRAAVHYRLVELGFDVLDLTDPFRDSIEKGVSPYQPNDGHLSLAGNHLAAARVSERLLARRTLALRERTQPGDF